MSRNTLILGAAVSGRAAARLAKGLGDVVTVYDRDAAAAEGLPAGVDFVSGEWRRELLAGQDQVIASPGIPPHAAPIVDSRAAPVELMSEMEFGFRHLTAPCLAVTGTNGKTTVVGAATEMLQASGIDAVAAGNIGVALSDVAEVAHEVVVVEASSFQLEMVDTFRPKAAAIVNVAPDHLDWHGSFEAYAAAKRRIGENQTRDDIIAFDMDDPGARDAVAGLPARKVALSGERRPAGGNGPDGNSLWVGDVLLPRPQRDRAFTLDLIAAATLAAHAGASAESMATVVAAFEPELHRRTVVGTWNGVMWVNDSKATNPHAAVASAAAYDSVVLIAGGRNKGLDLTPLPVVPSVHQVVALGEASDELEVVTPPGRFHRAGSIEEAVAMADSMAGYGDTVLLAPGCASFDMFSDYSERGRVFTDLVLTRKGT